MRPRASRKQRPTGRKNSTPPRTRRSQDVVRRTASVKSLPEFPVVGVGASAGGLEAFTQLLSCLPSDTGMAFVLIQHLDPNHESLLVQALSRATTMRVVAITDGMPIERDHVYVIPPNADAAVLHGALTLLPRSSDKSRPHLPVDFFFRALAADLGRRAIGVVLSGTASDGTAGLKAIKAEDGIALAQDPASAKFPGMPESAIAAGVVDAALTPAQLAEELGRLARHPYVADRLTRGSSSRLVTKKDEETLKKIFVLVRNAVGVDYTEYKPATLERRLGRRMAVRNVANREDYLKLLLEDPDEAKLLYEDVLIHVTSFFRDPEAFDHLKRNVFPAIVANKGDGAPIRVWVAGCSTGEEVYSLAISLLEHLEGSAQSRSIQIFGTDISEKAIEIARAGVYSDTALRDMSEERRRRFFTKADRGYRISKVVRELCVFVRHDLARDPPFSKLDLVSCRNVLIYFGPSLQKRIIATFHYCLNNPGFLLLGRTESISGFNQFFTKSERGGKTFERTARRSSLSFAARAGSLSTADARRLVVGAAEPSRPTFDLAKYVDRLLLNKYAPAGVLVNEKMDVLQFRGRTGAYLEPAAGAPQQNLFKMAREGLVSPLRMAFVQAKKSRGAARRKGLVAGEDGARRSCEVVVVPLGAAPDIHEPLYLVTFEKRADVKPQRPVPANKMGRTGKPRPVRALSELETELASTREYLESLVEDHARTNDDLASANEEFVSSNEELQSMNEELETAKEELQSTNEELTTVNDELHSRNQEVSQANGDLVSLLNSVDIPVVMLDAERRIKRFTPRARALFNLQSTDVGRPVDEIKPNLVVADLDERVAAVIAAGAPAELEVQDRHARWYRLQMMPSQDTESRIDGAIVSLIDIDTLKHNVSDAEWARDYANSIVEAVQVPLVVLDEELRARSANQAFYDSFQTTAEATEMRRLFDLDDRQWDIPALRAPLEQMLSDQEPLADLELEYDFPRLGRRVIGVSACTVHSRSNVPMILLALEDITARKRAEDERAELLRRTQAAKDDAERANRAKDEFLAMLSHELRTPLSTLLMQSQMLRRGAADTVKVHRISDTIERNTRLQVQLIDDLLDVSRIVTGKMQIEPEELDFSGVIQAALENVSALAHTKGVQFTVEIEAGMGTVSGDPVRLMQVVSNLLTNAVKFSAKEGRVSVNLSTVNGQAALRVSDRGRGIKAAFLPHIFDRFTQQDSSTTRVFGGLGLGLAIVRHIVERHGGSVRAESDGPGHGATFSVMLPLLATRSIAATTETDLNPSKPGRDGPEHDAIEARLRGMRILVVDDDVSIRETTTEILNMLGASVVATTSAADAMHAIDVGSFDVILCDLAMPEEDGYGFIRQLRQLEAKRGGRTPAIAFTALADDQNRTRSLEAGFQLHLSKPIDVYRLAASVVAVAKRGDPAN
jgi:two-component system CheB/CheR fusion protein